MQDIALSPTGDAAIAVERLVKRYGGRAVVNDLTFQVGFGEIFALLGPNGAGKTTTVEILEGYRAADGGAARVLGLDPRRDGARLKRRTGLMLQQGGIYPAITAREVLHLYARFYGKPADPDALLEQVGLAGQFKTRYRRLSGGQQRRLALAVALVGRPEVLFLDEPTGAMDPQARQLTWGIIRDLKARGVTVLLTTHLMDEAERLADRIAIVDEGRLVAIGTPQQLLASRQDGAATVRLRVGAELAIEELAALPGIRTLQSEGSGVYVITTLDPAAAAATITAWLRDHGVALRELRVGTDTLEDLFLRLTGRQLRQ